MLEEDVDHQGHHSHTQGRSQRVELEENHAVGLEQGTGDGGLLCTTRARAAAQQSRQGYAPVGVPNPLRQKQQQVLAGGFPELKNLHFMNHFNQPIKLFVVHSLADELHFSEV